MHLRVLTQDSKKLDRQEGIHEALALNNIHSADTQFAAGPASLSTVLRASVLCKGDILNRLYFLRTHQEGQGDLFHVSSYVTH